MWLHSLSGLTYFGATLGTGGDGAVSNDFAVEAQLQKAKEVVWQVERWEKLFVMCCLSRPASSEVA